MQSVKKNFNCFFGGLLIVLSALNMLLYFCGYCFVPSNCAAFVAAYGAFALISAALSAGYRRVKTKRSGSFGRIMPVILLACTVSLFFAVDFDGNAVCANIVIIISAVAAALIFFAVSDSVKMKNVIINICVGMIPAAIRPYMPDASTAIWSCFAVRLRQGVGFYIPEAGEKNMSLSG